MLWNPAFNGVVGSKADVSSAMPVIGSPVWALDTSLPATLFTDTAGTVQASASGALIARVANGLGGATYFQQATSGARPSLIFNATGSRSALRFDGVADFMALAGITNPGSLFQSRTFTMALTYRPASIPEYAGVFAAGNGAGGQGGNGFDMLLVELSSGGGWPKLLRNGGSDTGRAALTSPAYTGDNQVWKMVARSDPTNGMELRSKSASGAFSGTGPLPTSADSFAWDTAYIGAELGYTGVTPPAWFAPMDLFEVRFWNARAADTQFSQLQGYLDLKYGA